MNLIAFTGHSGVGKDTIAQVLEAIISEADPCPVIVQTAISQAIIKLLAYEFCVENFNDARSRQPELAREILKAAGNWMRKNDGNYLMDLINAVTDGIPADYLFITGVRFLDEIEYLEDCYQATIVRVINPSIPIHDPSHDTVRHIDSLPYHYAIVNTGTLEDLRKEITRQWMEHKFSSVGRPLICPSSSGDGQ